MKKMVFPILMLLIAGCGGGSGDGGSGSSSSASNAPAQQSERALLVVRIAYDDVALTHDAASWHEKFFSMQEGALNHFYTENSRGLFHFASARETQGSIDDGIIDVVLSKNHPNPSTPTAIQSDLSAALSQSDAFIDFSAYDAENDQTISAQELLLVFIVAGSEEAYGPSVLPGVFAHTYTLMGSYAPTLDGVKLGSNGGNYALFGERHCNESASICRDATVGIIAHELGHAAFNLPDLYDTTPYGDPDSAGIGYFGLMSAGMWGTEAFLGAQEGSSPAHFCAWSKIQNGWIVPQEMEQHTSLHVSLNEAASTQYNIFKIPIDADHYYLLENRNNSGYDRGLKAIEGIFEGGMALWKVDDAVVRRTWSLNMVNADPEAKGVDLIEAAIPSSSKKIDETPYARGHEKNLFYRGNVDAYAADGVALHSISARGNVMTLHVSKE
ncbi:MAG: M6 family metalloprotease domain-containing protein [Campylobacterales bacterium]|nr:M6 family metalloprotease domain-containing protein [Campylobacterales bacterium]